jgi:anti-anti-sigma regulatory factor
MSLQSRREDIILVNLPRKPQEHDELQKVMEMVHERGDSNPVADFSNMKVAGGTVFGWLLQLRQSLQEHGCTLVLCSVAPATRGVFTIARLDDVFDFVKDKSAALARAR